MGGDNFNSILDIVEHQAERRGDAIAFEDPGNLKLSYNDVAAKVLAFCTALTANGVERGSRVAIVLPNGVEMALALLGVSVTAVAVPLNPAFRREEFRSYFGTIRVGFLVVLKGSENAAREVASEMGIKVLELSAGGGLAISCATHRNGMEAVFGGGITRPEPDDIAAILMTSGSTGPPKKVLLSHRNFCVFARNSSRSLALGIQDRLLCMSGQFHAGGMCSMLTAPLYSGGTVIYTPGFNAAEFYRLVALKSPTWIRLAPTMMHELISHAAKNPVTTKGTSLRLIRSGGAAVLPQLMAEVEALFGIPMIQCYGMTESAAQLTSVPLPPAIRKPGSSGISSGLEISILDPDGSVLPAGEIGEVAMRGESRFMGYEDDPEATAEALRGGWFHTGDLGYLDEDSHLFLKGRLKQMINRGGETVNPHEIDGVLMAHPAVAQVASFAVKHRTLGEDIAVAVVVEPSASVTERELRGHVAERLASFKVPQRVIFLDRLPLGVTGKIDRLALAEMADEQAAGSTPGPVSDMEALVAQVWATELNLPDVAPGDNFFTIGGDSLSGVRVFLAVEKACGRPLPERALMDITTVREMARLIEAAPAVTPEHAPEANHDGLTITEKRSIMAVMAMGQVPMARPGSAINVINPGGSRPPLFWCFNSPGRDMAALAKHLDPEQPFYGLYSGGKLFARSDEMAANIARFYADEIVALRPDGPYFVGGECYGGRAATEIAKAMAASGRQIDKLCLLEYSHTDLHDFDGKLLLMFGKQSKRRAYREIGYGAAGWERKFRRPPSVVWVSGLHGRYFRPYNVAALMRQMDRFLQDRPQPVGRLSGIELDLVMRIHRMPRLFRIYMALSKWANQMGETGVCWQATPFGPVYRRTQGVVQRYPTGGGLLGFH